MTNRRACTLTLDGGFTQSGYALCDPNGVCTGCISVGACAPGSAPLGVYSRCASQDECGPTTCAVCGQYPSVNNPAGESVCYAYCQLDTDCAPAERSVGVTPRCFLGQCGLLCTPGATCPHDTQCLPWLNEMYAMDYPGFMGLCE